MTSEPRAYTAEECRAMLLDQIRVLVQYWPRLPDKTPEEICEGLAFSILNIFDGASCLPAFDIFTSPHPDDEEFHRNEGANWWPRGMVVNDCMLHEEFLEPPTGDTK